MPRKTKKAKTPKTAWLVEFGMLDRQRADIVVLTDGKQPTSEQLSDAYEALDGSEFVFDKDFSPDEGTHFVMQQMTDASAIETYTRIDMTGEYAEYIPPKPVGPPPEVWYCWREKNSVEDEDGPRLLIPWADPQQYEFPFDFIYETPEKAIAGLRDMTAAHETSDHEDPLETDSWILCKMTLEPVPRPK
jgi:hypothetical protein